jgi:hypothetical protein
MKANELMIGDWVFISHCSNRLEPCYGQVTGVDKNGEDLYTTDGIVDISLLKPISLSAEILIKNGLRRKEEYKRYEWNKGYVEIWVILGDSNKEGEKQHVIHIEDERRGIPVCYHNTIAFVHELQHALRLCGIEKEIKL